MVKIIILSILILTLCCTLSKSDYTNATFPKGFIFGAATASYQIEGGWNADGKGKNIWDTYTHTYRQMVVDRSNGDVACDSYHNYREDVKLVLNMGVNFYRFSVSWARVLPYGYANYVNKPGVQYYNNLIDDLLANGITPMITMYQWDLPQVLQDIGGLANPLLADYFVDYARFLFDQFGDRVKTWLTFNEPKQVCAGGYGTIYLAPGYVNQSGIADYLCAHTLLKAHARVYHMYKKNYKSQQNGTVGITIDTTWYEPNTTSPADVEAAFRKLMFSFGWYMNPIFYRTGNYPQVMIDRVGIRSYLEGFPRSRLPVFTKEEIEYIKGSYDFLGLNTYTSALVSAAPDAPVDEVSYFNDISVNSWQPSSWENTTDPFIKVTPWGVRKLLVFIKNYYGDFPIIITENGYADHGELEDYGRIQYYQGYLNNIYLAMTEDKVHVRGYTAWSLIDNFEWTLGYTQKFGLHYVNFTDPNRERTPKCSSKWFKQLIKTHKLHWNYTCKV